MFSLFKTAPLLDEGERQWLLDAFSWAYSHFDGEFFTQHSQIILPTNEFFAGKVSSVEQMAAQVFNQVTHYAGMQNWPLELRAPQNMPPQAQAFPRFAMQPTLRGEQAQLQQPCTPIAISYNPQQVNQPQDLVASLAQALATVLIYHKGVLPPGGKDYLGQATDLLACFLGFGVMMSNTVYQFRGGCGSCYNPYANRNASLTEAQTVYAFALIAHIKGDKHGVKHLKSHLRGHYKRAIKEIKTLAAQSADPLLLSVLPEAK